MNEKNEFFKNAYVCQRGKIFPWGMIRLFDNSVPDDGNSSDNEGGGCWSEKLVPYGGGDFYAKVCESTQEVVVFRKTSNELMASIPFDGIFVADAYTVVPQKGWLFCTGKPGLKFSEEGYWSSLVASLEASREGRHPEILDNSAFLQVSVELDGTDLIQVTIGNDNEGFRVYTPDGKLVDHKAGYPLSYAKWDPESQHAQYSRSEPVVTA